MNENTMNNDKEFDRQLLAQLIVQQKRTNIRVLILTIVAAVIVVILAVSAILIVPKAVTTLNAGTELIEEAKTSMDEIDDMVANVNTLVNANTSTVTDILEKVNGVNFDELNTSIQDLSNILNPLANFFSVFNK